LNALFQLPLTEERLDDWSAAISKTILQQGRLYLFTNYICFFSKIFGNDSREVIKLSDVGQMSKKLNGIEIVLQSDEKFFFTSFLMRSKAFDTLVKAWKKATNSSLDSDDDDDDDSKKSSSGTYDESEEGTVVDVYGDSVDLLTDPASEDIAVVMVTPVLGDESIKSGSPSEKDEKEEKDEKDEKGDNKDDEDKSQGSKDSDPGDQMSVHDGNVVYLWDAPIESSIHHSDVHLCETHHDHFDRVDLLQFFHLFYSDYSGDFARHAHKLLEEFDLECEPWTEREDGGKTRMVRFNSNLHGIPVGPSKTRITELQWYSLTTDMLVVRTVQNSLDIPYADFFDVESVWEFVRSIQGGIDLSIKSGVHWVKKTWLKSQVESTTLKKCKESHKKWCDSIKDYMAIHTDILGKRLVPGELRQEDIPVPKVTAGAASEKGDQAGTARRRKHKHHRHSRNNDSVDAEDKDKDKDKNASRAKYFLTSRVKKFSAQHFVLLVIWLLTVMYLIARIMALERDVERLSRAQLSSPPAEPPTPPPQPQEP